MTDDALPVTTISGYLGAGKTTLVNHLLRNANGVRLAILVNEFGALPIDADLIEAEEDGIISIAGGCVCCSYGNDMTLALIEMTKMRPRPDHILIEASGVAIPSAIAAATGLIPGVRADAIIAVADAETIERNAGDKYMGDTVRRQLSDADIIIVNKSDLVTPETMDKVTAWLTQNAPQASLVPCAQGRVAPAIILQSSGRQMASDIADLPAHQFDNLVLTPQGPLDLEALAAELATGNHGVIRAKGFATGSNGKLQMLQTVGQRWQVSATHHDATPGIVCLGLKQQLDHKGLIQLLERVSI